LQRLIPTTAWHIVCGMKRAALALLVLVAILFFPARSFSAIQEVADSDGNVTHYKYTDRNGSIVFTDSLAKIPEEYRKKNKVVRVGPAKKALVEKQAAPETAPLPETPALPQYQVKPEAAAPQGESSGGYLWLIIVLAAIGTGAAGFIVYRRVSESKKVPPRRQGNGLTEKHRAPARPADPGREHKRPDSRDQLSQPERDHAPEGPEDTLKRYLQARDFASAAKLCESMGDLGQAAANYLKANLFSEAAAIFESEQDFLRAAETYLKAGNSEKAAACFEMGGDPVKGYATLSRYSYDRGLVKEAALYAEKAGDLMQAATMFQEEGEFARAGDLFFQAGFYAEAAENFSQVNDLARAAEAHERAGNYLQAAQAYEKVGSDKEKLATLYEKGEDFYPAGRLFVKLGQLDRALNILQQVNPASTNYTSASLLVGMIFLKRGLVDLAREKFLKIIDNEPVGKSNLEPYYFLALCHGHAGEAEIAKAIFTKILAEDYNFRDVRKRLGG
jgi:tetratricopeptide (TPR) repeat protein